jgi:hypothetical protein
MCVDVKSYQARNPINQGGVYEKKSLIAPAILTIIQPLFLNLNL